jgi:hypothetical protein
VKNTTWTLEDIKTLKDLYPLRGPEGCAKILNRTPKACKGRAEIEGIRFTSKWWTEDEDNFLRDNYPLEGEKFCAEQLNRSISAVTKRASRLNISKLLCNFVPKLKQTETLLYFISFEHKDSLYYKLGITSKSLKQRYSGEWNSLNMKVIWFSVYENGSEAYQEEQKLKYMHRSHLIPCTILNSGNTEVFSHSIPQKSS